MIFAHIAPRIQGRRYSFSEEGEDGVSFEMEEMVRRLFVRPSVLRIGGCLVKV